MTPITNSINIERTLWSPLFLCLDKLFSFCYTCPKGVDFMPKALDLVGKEFGWLTVKYKNGHNKNGKVLWHCQCRCGNETDVSTQCLTKGESTSCGCNKYKLYTRHDLVGTHVNNLTVIRYVGKSKWECECDCGNLTIKSAQDLMSGRAVSCGKCSKENLIGEVFTNLRVVGRAQARVHGRTAWKCECLLCGTMCEVSGHDLKNGSVISCGCLAHKAKAPDLTNRVFGKLTVISREPNKNDRSMWLCRCECGKETVVSGKNLSTHITKSCGCLKHTSRCVDLTGQEFGELVVLNLDHIQGNKVFWNCYCKLCGHTKVVNGGDMKQGKIYSCGCVNVSHRGSRVENEIKDFVSQYAQAEKAIRILDRKEIDIFVPSLSLGIEYNGSKCHASKNNAFADKHYLYHRDKFLLAKEKGIHLISIFDVDWEKSSEKIKMYLSSILSPQKRLMARKCKVEKVEEKLACEFVDKYHIQGSNSSAMKINYGLYYEDELYAVMSFGKLRLSKTQTGQFELHRYCVKDGYTIVGGANKLLRAFENDYKPNYILSYSDNDYFMGGIYERLGFINTGQCRPRYYWFLDGLEIRREKCMLKHLRQLYPELLQEAYEVEAPNKEDYVMMKLGACKVYRSGNTRWEKYNECA